MHNVSSPLLQSYSIFAVILRSRHAHQAKIPSLAPPPSDRQPSCPYTTFSVVVAPVDHPQQDDPCPISLQAAIQGLRLLSRVRSEPEAEIGQYSAFPDMDSKDEEKNSPFQFFDRVYESGGPQPQSI